MPGTTDVRTLMCGALTSLREATRRAKVDRPAVLLQRPTERSFARTCEVNDLLIEGTEAVLSESGRLPPYRDTS
ncbi:hypothetical protein [Methylobacterium sp. WL6]|uniref:hypothetical protein n=1 Tax=Methylobacterium sp. WL6 TaxID=2603901 RepID=UPI0011C76CC0|nr:hypothetical protein [Methylobacterium sp. WL6]TXN72468.1 hypothetical protein FV230_04885 [Methylobacterium sp. WL6]